MLDTYEFVNKKIYDKTKLLVKTMREVKNDNIGFVFKSALCYKLFFHVEKIFDSGKDPQQLLDKELDNFIALAKDMQVMDTYQDGYKVPFSNNSDFSVQDQRSNLYGDLWVEFPKEIYFDETLNLLKTRFERNKIDVKSFKGKSVLDLGCGGGRYTVALSNFGFSKVDGFDMGAKGIADARERIKGHPNEKIITFTVGTVLKLPYKNESFDFVFSNGVLHHSENMEKGIEEAFRVLKRGGLAWIYVHHKGGLQNMLFDAVTDMLKDVPRELNQSVLKIMGIPPNRIFYFLDPFYAPINRAVGTEELIKIMKDRGFVKIRKLDRGTDFDTMEKITQKVPFAEVKYGEGDLRILAYKP